MCIRDSSYAETIREAGDDLSRETENDFLDVVISETDRMTPVSYTHLENSALDGRLCGRSPTPKSRIARRVRWGGPPAPVSYTHLTF